MAKKQYVVQVAGLVIALKILLVIALSLSVSTAVAASEVEDGSLEVAKHVEEQLEAPQPHVKIVLARYAVPFASDVPFDGGDVFAKQAHPWTYEIAKQGYRWIYVNW